MMRLLSVNVGKAQAIENAKSSGMTGIFKQPMQNAVAVHALGLEGDHINDTENHGGVDQAVYVYGQPDYNWWAAELGREMLPGMFGENLRVSDLESAALYIGDRLHVGNEVILEVTAPRIPCVTLAARMGDPMFVKRFRHAERPGVYCRVIQTGSVQAGDSVRLESYMGTPKVLAITLFRQLYQKTLSETELREALAAPIDVRARRDYEEKLAALEA
jgi:MOSC domain-containing protein YiiM